MIRPLSHVYDAELPLDGPPWCPMCDDTGTVTMTEHGGFAALATCPWVDNRRAHPKRLKDTVPEPF